MTYLCTFLHFTHITSSIKTLTHLVWQLFLQTPIISTDIFRWCHLRRFELRSDSGLQTLVTLFNDIPVFIASNYFIPWCDWHCSVYRLYNCWLRLLYETFQYVFWRLDLLRLKDCGSLHGYVITNHSCHWLSFLRAKS